jgi:hypothetical protein
MSVENPIPEGSWPRELRSSLGSHKHKVLFCGGAQATEPTQTTGPMLEPLMHLGAVFSGVFSDPGL